MHQAQWLTASPLWDDLAGKPDKKEFRRPALLRFATDSFMEEMLGVVAKAPATLGNYVARAETWREPAAGISSPGAADAIFKLFQPVQSRFYLVTSSLVCRKPGLPDYHLHPEKRETPGFVLRRLKASKDGIQDFSSFDPLLFDEYAWVDPEGTARWVKVDRPGLMAGEERLAMFPMEYVDGPGRRRVFCGLVPVSRRQTYIGGREGKPKPCCGAASNGAPPLPDDPRKIEFQRKVAEPWYQLVDWFQHASLDAGFNAAQRNAAAASASSFLLIDFADLLADYLPKVRAAVADESQAIQLSKKEEQDLYAALGAKDSTYQSTLREAMRQAKAYEKALVQSTQETGLPAGYPQVMLTDTNLRALIQKDTDQRSPIEKLIESALDLEPKPQPSIRLPARTPANPLGNDWFVIRCALERPQCGVNAITVLSEPTQPFQMASYFDADAPARSIQVALPVDTRPATLRKYDKNVAFLISSELNKQIARARDMKKLMDGEVDSPGLDIGWICSLSIPIITICAFFMLLIMLILLNIIFWWIPFFKICFPIPKFKTE